MTLSNILLVITATLAALMAGLFYAWSCSVMPGFARLTDSEFIAAMKSANRAIQNPIFFLAFFGAPIFLALSAFLHYGETGRFRLLLAGTVIYWLGTFGVTVFGNIPLNNALDRFNLETASEEETRLQRKNFEGRWNNLNTVRTISSIIAVIFVVIACLG